MNLGESYAELINVSFLSPTTPTEWLLKNRYWLNEPKHFLQHFLFITVTRSFSNSQPLISLPQINHTSWSTIFETHSSQTRPLLVPGKPYGRNAFSALHPIVISFPMTQLRLELLQEASPHHAYWVPTSESLRGPSAYTTLYNNNWVGCVCPLVYT